MTTQQMLQGIRSGKRYQVRGESGYGNDIYLTENGFIGWTRYGSSANENTLEGLNFVLDVIFKLTPDNFVQA